LLLLGTRFVALVGVKLQIAAREQQHLVER
jgi:hypothetical protein